MRRCHQNEHATFDGAVEETTERVVAGHEGSDVDVDVVCDVQTRSLSLSLSLSSPLLCS